MGVLLGWVLPLAVHLAGWVWFTGRIVRNDLESTARREMRSRLYRLEGRQRHPQLWTAEELELSREPLVDPEERYPTIALGAVLGILWPLWILPAGVLWLMRRMFRTPAEREYEDRRELEQLRRLAKEHGLTLPEITKEG